MKGVYTTGLCVSRFSSENNCSTGRRRIGIKSHHQILQGHMAPQKKLGKERVLREASFKSVRLVSAIRVLPDFRTGHKTKPSNKKDAPAEQHWTWRKVSFSSKIWAKLRFYSPIEARTMMAPTSKTPEER